MKNIFWKKCHTLYLLYIGIGIIGIVIGRYEKFHIGILSVSADKKIEFIGLYRYQSSNTLIPCSSQGMMTCTNDINVGWSQLGYICARKILGTTYIKITDGSGSIWNQLKIGLTQVENFFNLP